MHTYILENLKNEVRSHGLRSGEIIIELDQIDPGNNPSIENKIDAFFRHNNIKTEVDNYIATERDLKTTLNSIIYGLSVKLEYTKIDTVFSDTQKNKIAYTFIGLFNNPKFYSINSRVYRENLDLWDFWEFGGAILIDNEMIGIIWINDLYDKF